MFWSKHVFFIYGAEGSKATERAEYILKTTGFLYKLFYLDKDYTRAQLNILIP